MKSSSVRDCSWWWGEPAGSEVKVRLLCSGVARDDCERREAVLLYVSVVENWRPRLSMASGEWGALAVWEEREEEAGSWMASAGSARMMWEESWSALPVDLSSTKDCDA